MTGGEKKLWKRLKEFRNLYGVHVRKQVPIGPFIADFAVHSAKLVVELDGQFHNEGDGPEFDKKRDVWFQKAGYHVLRISTGEFAENPDGCIENILRQLGVVN